MQAVGKAALNRSLAEFQKALVDFAQELTQDIIIQSHLEDMQSTMLEQNLLRVLEPFSRVEARTCSAHYTVLTYLQLNHVASIINLPQAREMRTPFSSLTCASDDGRGQAVADDPGQKAQRHSRPRHRVPGALRATERRQNVSIATAIII